MPDDAIPRFFLYGEAPRAVADRFLNLESLDDRTRPANWNIRPHSHASLNHLFHIVEGGGEMRAEAQVLRFEAPCLILVPSGVVHGFAFETETTGAVLTVSDAYLQELFRKEAGFRRLFRSPATIALREPQLFDDSLSRLSRELAWSAPGHAAAVEALLLTLLVEILRLSHHPGPEDRLEHGVRAGVVARFRELVEALYRTETRVEAYASALSVSPKRLRSACLHVAGQTPLQIIHARLLLEAKRLMLYSNMTVAETAYHLGFSDPAYFSRFFARSCGQSPRSFRCSGAI